MYRKHVYWLTPEQTARIRHDLAADGRDVFVVRKAVCIPLSEQTDIGLIPPEAWAEYQLCRRQLSWYAGSRFAGRTLLVSSSSLVDFGLVPEVIIQEAPEFVPPRFPRREDLPALIRSPKYRLSRPPGWNLSDPADRNTLQNWLKVMGRAEADLDELFLVHSANHANFLEPDYFVTTENGPAPYSVGRTAEVCSSCLEFFNIIGAESPEKLVRPCPGAVLFARLTADRYYRVFTPKESG